jgi:hypothetical protein
LFYGLPIILQSFNHRRFRLIPRFEPDDFGRLAVNQVHFVKISILGDNDMVVIKGVLADDIFFDLWPVPGRLRQLGVNRGKYLE